MKKEEEEAEKWMSMISVDKEGTGALKICLTPR